MTTGMAWKSIRRNPSPSNGPQGSYLALLRELAHAELRIPVQVATTPATRSARERIRNRRERSGIRTVRVLCAPPMDSSPAASSRDSEGGRAKPMRAIDAKDSISGERGSRKTPAAAGGADRFNLRSSLRDRAGLFAGANSFHVVFTRQRRTGSDERRK
jgi:hypothetical protein